MKFTTVLVINAAAIGSYMAARHLLEDDTDLEHLPTAARNPLQTAQARLRRARRRARAAIEDARRERDAAERELLARYRSRAHR